MQPSDVEAAQMPIGVHLVGPWYIKRFHVPQDIRERYGIKAKTECVTKLNSDQQNS